ncbi:zinc-dependent alcohol dehydrogenase family protein [Pedobacter miscanthi]|uniref:NAD(P)-dependent alcohol dehydrogenase n=1 Tax=Pedobacter miscanthi TaxID=2259170 RepID=A0A366L1Y0_9SPHI|nr:NAD(P)-dependent alcohol dehydrogenase [Pedobacter miscanthi]RBQ07846.1 NAD(P)-dependent alcohol dehydrogenase [Pedobacter miscanthi]
MKTWEIQGFGLHNLKRSDREIPRPGKGQILVKVAAASLNFRDKAIIAEMYLPHLMKMPIIPLSDIAGTVVELGDGVTKYNVGDRVMSHLFPTWKSGVRHPTDVSENALGGPVDGGLAEYIVLDENAAVRSPDSLTDIEASTLPIAALTAWTALFAHSPLRSGQTVVTLGTGGVALFAVQFAKAIGAKVIALSGSDDKLELLRKLGADEVINYNLNPEWQNKILELTDGIGADNVIDIVGGESISRSVQAVANGGQVSIIGFLGGTTASIDLLPVIFKAVQIRGILVGGLDAFEKMVDFIETHNIKPIIEKVYPFDETLEAFAHVDRGPVGKLVIEIN